MFLIFFYENMKFINNNEINSVGVGGLFLKFGLVWFCVSL